MNTNVYTIMAGGDNAHYAMFIAIVVGNPEEWVENYLKERPQFSLKKQEGKMVWKGTIKWDADLLPYILSATEQTHTKTLGNGVVIEKNRDAYHYL